MENSGQSFDPHASSLSGTAQPEVLEELYRVRSSIDNIDAALIHLLAERFKATQRVGVLKATHSLPPADPGREAAQISRLRALARDAQLDPVFAEKFLAFIIDEVIRHHEAISENIKAGGDGSPVSGEDAGDETDD
ncbi:chorismate mutase [Falsarthrobacter nasiphocae]|uniref:Chorismate mutase n=1 Tax=Falsarthrobacter nasiphocae TaxID=189863 RepID=A0AAE4C7G7_9MICC|nr:chorismate mutase [Falsarthrobacter nasiphocae]MDR6891430.1 chorismate mutase [Falsarthrobacter nasiphocae]